MTLFKVWRRMMKKPLPREVFLDCVTARRFYDVQLYALRQLGRQNDQIGLLRRCRWQRILGAANSKFPTCSPGGAAS